MVGEFTLQHLDADAGVRRAASGCSHKDCARRLGTGELPVAQPGEAPIAATARGETPQSTGLAREGAPRNAKPSTGMAKGGVPQIAMPQPREEQRLYEEQHRHQEMQRRGPLLMAKRGHDEYYST